MTSIEQQVLTVAIGEIKGLIEPSDAERAAAYELVVELASRIHGLRVTSSDGSIRETLDTLEELFPITRGILREHGADATKGSAGNLSLAVVAVRVLNEVFAPVLTRWRPRLADHMARRRLDATDVTPVEWERLWPYGPQCRTELDAMAASIRSYLDTLSRIAGTPDVADAVLHPPSSMIFEQRKLPASAHPDRGKEGAARPRRKMVRWLSLVELIQIGRSHLRHGHARPAPPGPVEPVASFPAVAREDFWFDYVADMGDAFDGTAPIAYLVGRHRISIPDDASGEFPSPPAFLPRTRLLVFGGDQVYPYATAEGYRNQTELPYAMGVEDPGDAETATLLTIPGNHDWLGGIEHFEEMFASGRRFAGRWETPQRRPYWHAELPQGWWIWGIDTGLHNKWPEEQVDYFEKAALALRPGDRVILCTPVPLWQLRQKFPHDYVALRSEFDRLITHAGASMPLCLSGDTHIFAHYERIESEEDEDHITSGGGGAFLQPTHNLDERIPHERGNAEFRLASRWPLASDSRALASGAEALVDPNNWLLAALFSLLHLAFAGLRRVGPDWFASGSGDLEVSIREFVDFSIPPFGTVLRSPWTLGLLLLVVVAGSFGVKSNSLEGRLRAGSRLYGVLLGAAVAASLVAVGGARVWADLDPPWIGVVLFSLLGGFVSFAVAFEGLKWANSRIRAGDTGAFSPAALTRYKHFLRCRIDQAGDLTVYVVGIDPVGEKWYEAMTDSDKLVVPPFDEAGIPRIHYVWGRTYRKFVPVPMEIAVSVSDVPDERPPEQRTESIPQPDEAFRKTCSKLIDGGHTLMYGGLPVGPGYEGFTKDLHEIEKKRHIQHPNPEHHLINYVADPYWTDEIDPNDPLMRSIHVVRPGADGGEDAVLKVVRDLTEMRHRMTRDADVRIVIGGNPKPGRPGERLGSGVIEEAYLALEAGKPLLVVGGFGGAAGLIADALFGRLDPARVDELERHFLEPAVVSTPDRPVVGFREMLCAFSSFGQLRNGLLDGENRELLTTCDVDTIVTLVWKSMQRLGRQHRR